MNSGTDVLPVVPEIRDVGAGVPKYPVVRSLFVNTSTGQLVNLSGEDFCVAIIVIVIFHGFIIFLLFFSTYFFCRSNNTRNTYP